MIVQCIQLLLPLFLVWILYLLILFPLHDNFYYAIINIIIIINFISLPYSDVLLFLRWTHDSDLHNQNTSHSWLDCLRNKNMTQQNEWIPKRTSGWSQKLPGKALSKAFAELWQIYMLWAAGNHLAIMQKELIWDWGSHRESKV